MPNPSQRQHRAALLKRLGLDPKDQDAWWRKRHTLQVNARLRGLEVHLTYDEYVTKVAEAGITSPSQIGKKPGLYQMGRKGDKGNYTVKNCRYILQEQNQQEKMDNGGFERGHAKIRGRVKSTSEIENQKAGQEKNLRLFKAVSPEGKVYKDTNLHEFCASHGLAPDSLGQVLLGVQKRHLGWTGMYLDKPKVALHKPKIVKYEIVSPRGKVYMVDNLNAFCVEHGLGRALQNTLAGRNESYRGWTGRYLTDEESARETSKRDSKLKGDS